MLTTAARAAAVRVRERFIAAFILVVSALAALYRFFVLSAAALMLRETSCVLLRIPFRELIYIPKMGHTADVYLQRHELASALSKVEGG